MAGWHEEFLERCCRGAAGVAVGQGAFGPGPALWVGRREVAHFDGARALDVRLTRAEMRRRRDELRADARVVLRRGSSDWIGLTVETDDDLEWARQLVIAAVEANRPTAPDGPPPEGADLARRRRFH